MYLAMSRLKILAGKERVFEEAWKIQETSNNAIKGFKRFNLMKGNTNEEYTLYIFYSEWNSEKDFINWTNSVSFRLAHKNPVPKKNQYLGPPNFDGYQGQPDFEGFKVVI